MNVISHTAYILGGESRLLWVSVYSTADVYIVTLTVYIVVYIVQNARKEVQGQE